MRASVRCLSALALVSLAIAPVGRAQIQFVSRTDAQFGTLGNPVAMAVGAFVADAGDLPDLAVTFDREDSIGIFENQGDGSFALVATLEPPPPPPVGPPVIESNVGTNPADIIAIDLDGDTVRDDIAGVNQDQNRFFAYENGGGAWTAADPDASGGMGLSCGAADWSSSVIAADGFEDLFIATNGGAVGIAISAQDGTFDRFVRFFTSGDPLIGSQPDVEMGDFVSLGADAGQPDLLTVDNSYAKLVVWPGNPTLDVDLLVDELVFKRTAVGPDCLPSTTAGEFVGEDCVFPVEAIVRDWDDDGLSDALVAVEEGYALWFRGNGDPTLDGFDDPLIFDLAGPLSEGERMPTSLTSMQLADVVDVSGSGAPDGIDDLILVDAGQTGATPQGFNWLWIVPGTAPAAGMPGAPDFDVAAQYKHAAPDVGALKPRSLAVGDFGWSGGLADVVLAAFDSSNHAVFLNDGTGAFDAARSYSAGVVRARGLAPRQAPGGDVDVVVMGRANELPAVVAGDGSGALLEPSRQQGPSGLTFGDEVQVGLVDGDAEPDVVLTFRAANVLYRGLPGGDLGAAETIVDGGEMAVGESRLGDLGGGGGLDLAVFDTNPVNPLLEIWRGGGDGSFVRAQAVPGLPGFTDMAIGSFVTGALDSVVVSGTDSSGPSPGRLFLVAADGTETYASVGAIGFPPPFGDIPGVTAALLVPGDFDRNGHDDVIAILSGGQAFLFRSDGSALLDPPALPFDVGGAPRSGLASDLDGDGLLDLVVAGGNRVSVLRNLGGTFAPPMQLRANIDCVAVTAPDLDGNGLPDLAVTSERTNDVTVFLNDSAPPFRLRVTAEPTGTRVSWTDVEADDYTLVRGNLAEVWATPMAPLLDSTELPCQNFVATFLWDDPDPLPVPPPGQRAAAYYLLRCAGVACTEPSFGTDTFGLPRYAMDPPDPCP